MPAMRVHELAKEFGMTSKELLDHLTRLKIPARNHASTLVEAYVDKIRKDMADIIAVKQAELAAEQAREEAERAKIEAAEAAKRAKDEAAARKAEETAAEERRLLAEEEAQQRAEAEERASREAEETTRREAEVKAEEERRLLAEEAAKIEAEEAERYRQMAREAEAAQREQGIIAEAAKLAQQAVGSKRKKKQPKKPTGSTEASEPHPDAPAPVTAPLMDGALRINEGATVGEFAEAAGLGPNDIIKRLLMLGELLTVNQPLSRDLMDILAEDIGVQIEVVSPEVDTTFVFVDDPDDLVPRPPVVTVMGHVDHGKTSLLDAIRETGVAATEAGGITQHIGASVVRKGEKQITFIDTPGHEAFTAMRARGAKVTDVAVLVVAADDGVMPQTVEAIHHAKAAGVPIIVAVNKIDKDGANPERVRQELTGHEIVSEEWGGSTIFVNVSAKQRIAIDDLLEMILLQADVLELKSNPKAMASGIVIEAKLDKGRGPVATVLVQRGTLRPGDALAAGTTSGRVRALNDPKGSQVTSASPGNPVEILGLGSVPSAGDEFRVFADEREARSLAEERSLKQRLLAHGRKTHVSLDDLFSRIAEGQLKDLNLVVKADVQGSIEALKDALDKMDQTEVHINVIHGGVGGITESDVMLASASDAIIIGFNVRPAPKAKALVDVEKVDMRLYRVIYQAIEEINAARVGMLAPTIEERDTARIEIRELFKVPKTGTIAGCFVTEGEVSRDDQVRIVRDGTVVHDGRMGSLRRFKEDVKAVKAGYECGIGIDNFQDLKEGDIIEAYKTIEVARQE